MVNHGASAYIYICILDLAKVQFYFPESKDSSAPWLYASKKSKVPTFQLFHMNKFKPRSNKIRKY